MDISNKIKSRRKELGLTQQQVAERVFVTRQTISKWELGKSQPDLIRNMKKSRPYLVSYAK